MGETQNQQQPANIQNTSQQVAQEQSIEPQVKSPLPAVPEKSPSKNIWQKLNPIYKKIIYIVLGFFLVLILIAVVYTMATKMKEGSPVVEVSPGPSAETGLPEDYIANPSQYATDSGVLKIEEKISSIEEELGKTVINDLKLMPPNLFFDLDLE